MAQYSLVGDLIQSVRELSTDPPLMLSAPTGVAVAISGGASTTNFWFKVTQLTPWGESEPCAEIAVTSALISGTFTVTGNCSFAASAIKVYVSLNGAGYEDRYYLYSTTGGIGAFSINFSLSSTLVVGFPSQRSSAALPDTDGSALSATAIYRWLNEGLDSAAAITGGIRDVTGVASVSGQAQYPLLGNWRNVSNGFYDGYPFGMGNKKDVFRHSNVTGIVGTMVMNQDSNMQRVEVWPQPSRTSGTGTLSGDIAATDSVLTYAPGATSFVLGFGLALLGDPSDLSRCEIVYYSGAVSNQLTQLQRGMGGTTPQAWTAGTVVYELNIYLSGLRYPNHYSVGMSVVPLSLPPDWIDAVRVYLEARYKAAEQNTQESQAKLQEFKAKCQEIKGNRQVLGPRQIQAGGGSGVQCVAGAGGFFGGVVLP